MQHTQGHSQDRNSSSTTSDPNLEIFLDTFRGIKTSGNYYFFVGGGAAGQDHTSERLSPSTLNSEALLREVPWSFGDINDSHERAIVSVAHGRGRSIQGGGDLFIVCTAFPYGDREDPRVIAMSCHVKDGNRLNHIGRQLNLSPLHLQKALGVFDDRFASGELLLARNLKIVPVPATISFNEHNGMTEYRRGSSRSHDF